MLRKAVCARCFQYHEKPWDEEDWAYGNVFCPKEIVAPEVQDPPIQRLLGTIFGMTEVYEIPVHCPYKHEHQEIWA